MVSSNSVQERDRGSGEGDPKKKEKKCLGESRVLLSHLSAPQVQVLRVE